MHIVEEAAAQRAFDAACDKWDGADDAWQAATWVILHDKAVGVPLNSSGSIRFAVFEGARSKELPTIEITYEIDGDRIIIHQALFRDSIYGQAGHA